MRFSHFYEQLLPSNYPCLVILTTLLSTYSPMHWLTFKDSSQDSRGPQILVFLIRIELQARKT